MKTMKQNNETATRISTRRTVKAATLIVALILSSTLPYGTRAASRSIANQKKNASGGAKQNDVAANSTSAELSKPNDLKTRLRLNQAYSKLPLSFEANQGQVNQEVKFLSHGAGSSLFLTANEAVLSLSGEHGKTAKKASETILRLKLVGGNAAPQATGLDELPGKSNYFLGSDSSKWHTNVPRYRKALFQSVYSGIDLVYYGSQRDLEYDFIVAPGADPNQIKLSIDGAQKLTVDANGDLVIKTAGGAIHQHKPRVYQESEGKQTEITSRYVLDGKRQVVVTLGAFNVSRELIIDPVLAYSSYHGGSEDDHGNSIAVDANGNAYVTGYASSTDFPSRNGYQPSLSPFIPAVASPKGQDAFVTKFDPSRTGADSLIYSTYLGGTKYDAGNGIAVDSQGNAYVTGWTTSVDIVNTPEIEAPFPTVNAFQPVLAGAGTIYESCNCQDAFVSKLSANGSALLYSTYLGGSGTDEGASIAVDSSGYAYVTGTTHRESGQTSGPYFVPFPLKESLQDYRGSGDAFVAKFDTTNAGDLSLVFSSPVGGRFGEFGRGIAVTPSGDNIYLAGETISPDFPTLNAYQPSQGYNTNVFVTVVRDTRPLTLQYSTYLGSTSQGGGGFAKAIAIDAAGNAYVTGLSGYLFPRRNPLPPESGDSGAFVTKINPFVAGDPSLIYSYFFGKIGTGAQMGTGVTIGPDGSVYVAGWVDRPNLATVKNAVQPVYGGGNYEGLSPN